MKEKLIKLNWKGRLIFGFVSGIVNVCVLYLLDTVIEENTHSLNYYIIQGIAFGLLCGIGLPYVSKKFENKITKLLKIFKLTFINKNAKQKQSQSQDTNY